MIIENRVLRPDEGYLLTQSPDDTPLESRIFTPCVLLADNDSVANWREITVADADILRVQRDAAQRERLRTEGITLPET